MKNYKAQLTFLILLISASITAQIGGIKPLKIYRTRFEDGYYYKDTDNTFNNFVGTWVYINGSSTLQIKFKKITKFQFPGYFIDALVGEYQYIKNGTEQINTLSQLNTNLGRPSSYSIFSDFIMFKNDRPFCTDCSTTELRVCLTLNDVLLDVYFDVYIRKIMSNGQHAIDVKLKTDGLRRDGTTFDNMTETLVGGTIPNGEYILIKQ